jgi:hypothetical protein
MSRTSKLFFSFGLFVALCCASIISAHATTVTFTTRAAFNAATTGTTTINFNGVAPTGGFVGPVPLFTSAGVTFTAPGNNLFIVDAGFEASYDFGAGFDRGGVLSAQGGTAGPTGAGFTIIFSSAVTAVGFDVNSFTSGLTIPDPVTVFATLSNGDVVNFTTLGIAGRFFGFTTTPSILSLTLRTFTPNAVLNIDSFTFGQAAGGGTPITEPATMILLGTGLAGIAAKVRRRRKQ